MDIDLRAIMGALGGTAFYGLVQFGARVKSGHDITWREWSDLLINIACAAMCGVLMTIFLAKAVAPLFPIAAMRDAQMVGLFFGAFGWELLPLLYTLFLKKVTSKATDLEGGK
jgi:hypothetical protein